MSALLEVPAPMDVASPAVAVFTPDEERVLEKTQSLRLQLLGALCPDGTIPQEKADKTLLVSLLNGVDSQAVSKARLRVSAKTEENAMNYSAMVAKALLSHRVLPPPPRDPSAPLVLPPEIKLTDPVPGETDIGLRTFSIDELGINDT